MRTPIFALSMTLLLGALAGCAADVEEDPSPEESHAVRASSQALTTTSFSDTHINANSWGWPGCGGFTRHLTGEEPTAPGTYPVFLYFVGYDGDYQGNEAIAAIQAAAAKGYVAASIEYTNAIVDGPDCAGVQKKADCAFDTSLPNSAISKICGRAKADCSKGIVIYGHSIGGGVAILAYNKNTDVRAVATMGTSMGDCYRPENRDLPIGHLVAFAGQNEALLNGPGNLNLVTGENCSSGTRCPNAPQNAPITAGWYQVQNSQVADGDADHCYFNQGGCGNKPLDPTWSTGTAPWSLNSVIDWLDGFVDH